MTDFSKLTLANNVRHARTIIDRAEADLGELSRGQCVDLLCDQTHWSWQACDDAVTVIRGPRS